MFTLVFTREGESGAEHCEAGCWQRSACPRYATCPKTGADVDRAETERWERLFWPAMKSRGVFLTPNQFESQFVSAAHTTADIETAIEAYKTALAP